METTHTKYRKALEVSLRVAFRIEDVLPVEARFDFSRPMLPEALAQVEDLSMLSTEEQLTLNHIRGHSYLGLFGLVEEFILPFVADHARSRFGQDDYETRALLHFASEEAKHIHLFKLFSQRFTKDFGRACPLIGPAASIAEAVLSHHPLGVGLMTLHIEWMTQHHYVDAVKSCRELEPLFTGLLRNHWIEEAQHAQLDGLIVDRLAAGCSPAEVARGIADYHRIVALLEGGLRAQAELDVDTLEASIARELTQAERATIRRRQEQAYRYTFIQSGADHPRFLHAYSALTRM